jgi:hypothetical protein
MLCKHVGLAITPEQRLRFVALLTTPPTSPSCPPTRSSAPRSKPATTLADLLADVH